MSSRFRAVVIDCHDDEKVAAFWAAALDRPIHRDDDGEPYLESEDGSPQILFLKVPEAKSVKNRLHIDLSPRDREQDAEVERLIALGATRIDIGQGDVSWVVLADPEGNEFCVLRTRRP